jgi:hypothetical protein
LRGYQLHGGFTPGPLYAIAVLAGLAGSVSLLAGRRHSASRSLRAAGRRPSASQAGSAGDDRRSAAAACLVFFTAAVSVLLMSDLFEFSWRYQLPALVTLIPAGALGLAAVWPLLRRPAGAAAGADG